MHQSIATISSPEFINLQPLELNPLMSSCEIKVLYVGENRNHSFITKDVATEMSKTLRGAPIVGYYKADKADFADHGERVTFDDEGVKFECLTKPYGFVSPDAKVWFQKFEDYDDFGNTVEHEYLMTTGYLWTGQFEECKRVVDGGNPQSMELDKNSLNGYWSQNKKSGMDFFIINDAIFSKLCILGDDVEPCFEGASVSAPEVSTSFALDDNFKNTLYSMMQDLKNFALQGGQQMENLENTAVVEEVVEAAPETEFEAVEEVPVEESAASEFKKEEEKPEEPAKDEESEDASEEPADTEDEEDKKKKLTEAACGDKKKEKYEEESEVVEPEAPEMKTLEEYSLLEAQLAELKTQYSQLEEKYAALVEFKESVEDAKKDELIKSFYMLSDEDKKDVIENKRNYSYDEIEKNLAVICVRKKVNFDLDDNDKNDKTIEETPIVTFNLDNVECSVPAYVRALKSNRENN